MADFHDECVEWFRGLQDRWCAGVEALDGHRFAEERWDYHLGAGGGRTRVLTAGGVIEKGGVNFSAVEGEFPEDFAKTMPGSGRHFRAAGVSLVLHPRNPRCPTVHANFRRLTKGDAGWFGGGGDLTPYYPYRADAVHFHRTWRDACARHPAVADYRKMKADCDRYFHLPHRNEARGIGGIFFDYVQEPRDAAWAFVRDAADSLPAAYLPIAERRAGEPSSEAERQWQLCRRGRYVEFNLIHDRGTLFGLRTGGRTESILMSLPPLAAWPHRVEVAPDSWEAELLRCLEPRDWIDDPPFGR